MEDACLVILGQDSRRNIDSGIGFHDDFLLQVEVHEDWGHHKCLLEFLEYNFGLKEPLELDACLNEGREGGNHTALALNESLVEAHKLEESQHFFEWGGEGQFWTAETFVRSMEMLEEEIISSKYLVFWSWNSHFSRFKNYQALFGDSSTPQKWIWSSSMESEYIKMLSI